MQMAGSAIGAGAMIAGAALSAGAADRRKKYIEKIAATPGLDIGKTNNEVVAGAQAALPGAQKFASDVNMGSQADINSVLESAIPGYSPMQRSRANAIGSMIKGEIPQDVLNQVYKHSAAQSLGGGYGYAPAGRNLTARDLGLTSLDIMGKGLTGMQGLMSSTPLPRMMQANDILNFTGAQGQALRESERMKAMDIYLGAANSPGSQDVWGKALTDMGGSMMGSSGGGGGGAGGMGGIMSLIGSI